MAFSLKVNGIAHDLDVDGDTPILWAIRDDLGLTGTKFGCGVAACGACTVHVDGVAVRGCQYTVEDAQGSEITTIEGLNDKVSDAVKAAWRELDVVQCGFCQSGQIMQAIDLLANTPKPTDQDIDDAMNGNACRCATYVRIRAAIHRAADILEA